MITGSHILNGLYMSFFDYFFSFSSCMVLVYHFVSFQILSSVLETTPFSFSIKLAVFAYRKEYISIEQWLSENLSTYKSPFFQVLRHTYIYIYI